MKFEDLKDLPHLQGIYKFTNLENYKECVGKGDDLWIRLNKGYPSEINGSETNRPIVNALRYYGWDKFNVEILYIPEEKIDNNILLFLETSCICEYKTHVSEGGYNICRYSNDRTGYVGFFNHSEESKDLMSKNRTGKTDGEKHFMYGKHHTQETKDNIANALKGRIITKEWRDKISKNNARKRSVKQIDKNTHEIIKIFESAREASRTLFPNKNIKSIAGDISKCCNKQRPSAQNYKWEYV